MQYILFISNEKPDFYPEIDKHYTWYPIHKNLNFEEFSKIWHEINPLAVYTYNISNFDYLKLIFNIRKRWIHLNNLPQKIDVIPCVFSAMLKHQYDDDNPLLSVITTTFHSKEKILRPLRTLKNQTYTNWEWIIWDDSKDDETYKQLLEMQKTDLRIRIYKAPSHSGVIGEMKRIASGVAYGKYLVELDHDDEIHPELFKWILDASKQYKDAEFFYTDSAQLYEETLNTHSYGDFFGYGYAAHEYVWSKMHNKWVISTIVAPPNPITLRHLVGMPNHIRVWKTEFYDKIGKHNPLLSVSDDYELLVKSYLNGKWCHIRNCGYYQYRNKDGNFTFIRNSLIQHNVKQIYEFYKQKLPQPKKDHIFQPFWKYDEEFYSKTHYVYDPNNYDYSIILIDPTKEILQKAINLNVKKQICIVGKLPTFDLSIYDKLNIRYWDLKSDKYEDKVRYAKKMMVLGKNILYENDLNNFYNFNKPKLNIITPCCRQDNLHKLKDSINFDLINKWYIIYDTSKNRMYNKIFTDNNKIEEHEYSDEKSVAGHAQRNYGLGLIDDGLIYFLDDDNIIHHNFWDIIKNCTNDYFYTFDQLQTYNGKLLLGNNIKVYWIDTAQYILSKKFINDIKFDITKYHADGLFIESIYKKFSNYHIYIPKIGCFYNYIDNKQIINFSNIDFTKPTKLCKLFGKYGSDKGNEDIINSRHNYSIIYNELFKNLNNINIFELGIGSNNNKFLSSMENNYKSGGSLYSWNEYFNNSNIYSADIDKTILFNTNNIKTFYCDETNINSIKELWNNITETFDIMIDDGIHEFNENVLFFENSIFKLNNNGFYIIEDIKFSNLLKFRNKITEWKEKYSDLSFNLLLVPSFNNYHDNNLLIIKKLK